MTIGLVFWILTVIWAVFLLAKSIGLFATGETMPAKSGPAIRGLYTRATPCYKWGPLVYSTGAAVTIPVQVALALQYGHPPIRFGVIFAAVVMACGFIGGVATFPIQFYLTMPRLSSSSNAVMNKNASRCRI